MARSTTPRQDAREAVIGRSTRIRGRISGDGDLVIEGNVEGDIDVGAGAVTVRGEVEGDIRARGAVRIESGARVRGDVSGELSMEEGAEFVGNIEADFEMPAELGGSGGGKRR
jgi:cytoskeletal protein CcmA (bactofilin family)